MFKPLRMSDTAVVCSLDDPAIDWPSCVLEGEDIAAAQKRVASLGHKAPSKMLAALKFKDGEQATKFTIGVIPPDEFGRIQDECAQSGKVSQLGWRSFIGALRGVEPWSDKAETVKIGDTEYCAPAWIKRTFIRGLRDIACEVGLYAWAFNRLTDDEVRLP